MSMICQHPVSLGAMARTMSALSDEYMRLARARRDIWRAQDTLGGEDPALSARADALTARMVAVGARQKLITDRYLAHGGVLPFWPATKAA